MEPVPEVRDAARRLSELTGIDVLADLNAMAGLSVALVPSCVGVSVTVVVDGEAFTLTSTTGRAATLDAVQYLDDGPCIETTRTGGISAVPDVLDEQRWQFYASAAAAAGVRSSLSIPTRGPEGTTAGAVNVYASDPDAFRDVAAVFAAALQVPVERLVTNADLSFRTREYARDFPARLAAKEREDVAVGMLAALHGWNGEPARTRLRDAATRAGVTVEQVAEVITAVHGT
jgi:alkylhydroperoxidase/carboxymuconolactone decarboxylase family protein YurZ